MSEEDKQKIREHKETQFLISKEERQQWLEKIIEKMKKNKNNNNNKKNWKVKKRVNL